MTIATTEPQHQAPDMGAFDERDEKVLSYLGLNPNSPADRAAVMVCRAYDLDAVLKHVVVIPKGGVYITRDGLLHIAHRSGQLDGIVVDQEPTLVNGEWVAKVSVYRKDMSHPFTFPGRYSANGMNKQYAQEMALKAAESHALRRAFSIAGLPTESEQRPEPQGGGLGSVLNKNSEPSASQDEGGSSGSVAVGSDVGPDGSESAITEKTRKAMFALMASVKITEDDDQRAFLSDTLGRLVESRATLTEAEGITAGRRLRLIEQGDPSADWVPSFDADVVES